MADRFVMSHIRRLPLFAALPDQYLASLSEAFRVTRYEPGEVIFRQGMPSQGMYMFVSGRGVLLQQTPAGMRQIGVIEGNQFLNEAALLRESIETATFQVVETAIVLFLSRVAFQNFLTLNPQANSLLRMPTAVPPPVAVPSPQGTQTKPAAEPKFKGQRDGEKLMLMTRRHWWAYVRRVWLPLFVAAVLFAAVAVMPSPELRLVVLGMMIFIPGTVMTYFYLEWNNDLLIVTDQRIVRIEHTILTFNSQLNEIPIKSVQAVDTEIPTVDPFARLFRYGNIIVKTAGKAGTITLSFVPEPEAVQDIIFERINDKSEEARRSQNAIRNEIERALGNLPPAPPPTQQVKPKPVRPGLLSMRYINANGDTVYRKHWLYWLRGVSLPLLALMGCVALLLAWLFVPAVNTLGIIVLPLLGFAVMAAGLWFYWADWDWRNDLYVINDNTVTFIHRRPLWLQNEDDRILINRIDNVSVEVTGLLPSMLNYGNVKIALVGEATNKVFRGVPNPRGIQEEISQRQAKARQAVIDAEERRRHEEIARYIAAYDEAQRTNRPPQYAPQTYAPSHPSTVPPTPPQPQMPPTQVNPPVPPAQYGTGIPSARPNPADRPSRIPPGRGKL
jgi:CRP/FNR family transcriptional regulator, cyclic AMP receptor protein